VPNCVGALWPCGLREPRLREDGATVVHAQEPGYRVTGRFTAEAAPVVGTYVMSSPMMFPALRVRPRRCDRLGSADHGPDSRALGVERYDADVLARPSIQRLWITVGNYAEAYRLAAGIATGTQPWSEMYGYRSVLAHMLPEGITLTRESVTKGRRRGCAERAGASGFVLAMLGYHQPILAPGDQLTLGRSWEARFRSCAGGSAEVGQKLVKPRRLAGRWVERWATSVDGGHLLRVIGLDRSR
jgi:hypothetical protein